MKNLNKKPAPVANDKKEAHAQRPGKFRGFGSGKSPGLSDNMPACFREMWDVFLSFSRLNY